MTADAHEAEDSGRITSPMQSFGTREVVLGLIVAAIGLFVTFVLPFLV